MMMRKQKDSVTHQKVKAKRKKTLLKLANYLAICGVAMPYESSNVLLNFFVSESDKQTFDLPQNFSPR